MEQVYTYYVPFVIQKDGQTGFSAKMVDVSGPLDSPEAVVGLIDSLTAMYFPDAPEEGELPIMPLGWTLITAKRITKPSDNGRDPAH